MKETDSKVNQNQAEPIGDCHSSSDEEEYDDIDDDADEDENMEEATICLFCPENFASLTLAIKHLEENHKVKLPELQQKFQMDQYGFIKLVNYIRANKLSSQQLLEAHESLWDDEKYLKPLEYEPWLCFDLESLKPDNPQGAMTELEMRQRLAEQANLLQQANEDMERMREDYKNLLQKLNPDETLSSKSKPEVLRNNASLDKEYFNSYSHFGIHHEMLSDKVRTNSYRLALLQNAELVKGKSVLDVGCGTGILSIFASQAGAEQVVGIDNSEIVYTAMDIVRKNNFKNIKLVKGRLEDTELPEAKYDIIISEWMGYFLLYESMLDSIIYAREQHLKPNGLILPSRCTLSLLGYGNDQLYAEQVEFWSDVYGVDMSDLRKRSIEEPLMEVVSKEFMLTEPEQLANFEMMTVDLNYPNFTHNFNLKCTQTGRLSAFVGYFDTFFELPHPVMFSTSLTQKPTHWKQTVFFIDKPQAVEKGQIITGKISSRRQKGDIRALNVEIEVFGKHYKYTVD